MRDEGDIQWMPVKELGEVRMGKQLSPASRAAEVHFPYLRVANVFEGRIDFGDVKTMGYSAAERATYALNPGDILLNEGQENLGMVGRSAIYNGPPGRYFFQNTLIRFRPGPDLLPEYAQAVFVNWRRTGVFAGVAEKTSISHLGGKRFASLLFPYLRLPEQRRIVKILDSIAESERAIEASIAKLRQVRRGIALSAIPLSSPSPTPGWIRVPLKEVVPSVQYGISAALTRDSRGLATLRMNNLRNGFADVAELRYCPTAVRDDLLLKHGDVLFNRTNSIDHVGRAGMWRGELPSATFASYLVRLDPDRHRLTPEYLVEWLQHPVTQRRVRCISTVAVQQVNVNPSRLRELDMDLPSDTEAQSRITTALAATDARISREEEERAKLRNLRQGLANDLLSGGAEAQATALA